MDHLHQAFRSPVIQARNSLDEALQAATCQENALSWEQLSATATLVTTKDGSPLRTIITGRRRITTGTYASRKAGRSLPYESMNERAFFMHSEVDANVVDYRAQPFRFEFVMEGRRRAYIVDCIRLLADGTIEIVEVKHDQRALQDPDYAEKLEAVRLICEQIGWRFRIVMKSALLEPEFAFRNVLEVQSWRFTAFDRADEFLATGLLRQSSMMLDDLASALGRRTTGDLSNASRALGKAKLMAMMVKRAVRIDLSKPIDSETRIELVVDQPEVTQ